MPEVMPSPKRQPEARGVKDIDSGAQSEQCVKNRGSGTPEYARSEGFRRAG